MSLTWKDAVSTGFMAVIVAAYVAFLNGTSFWLISSARGTAIAVLVLGMVGGCAMSEPGNLYAGPRSATRLTLLTVTSLLGVTALAAGIIVLVTASTAALAVLVGATLALWLEATLRHLLTVPGEPVRTRDTHEVIHQPGHAAPR
jgi:hypothetical protein